MRDLIVAYVLISAFVTIIYVIAVRGRANFNNNKN